MFSREILKKPRNRYLQLKALVVAPTGPRTPMLLKLMVTPMAFIRRLLFRKY